VIRPWKDAGSKLRGDYKVFRVHEVHREDPRTDQAHPFYVLHGPDWVNVIALTPGNDVLLIRQFRQGTAKVTLEIPGGGVDPGEDPAEAARRELLEETGFAGAAPEWLGTVHPNPAIQSNRCHTYRIRDAVRRGPARLDGLEDIETELRPLADVDRLLRDGEITHSLVVAAFQYLTLRDADRTDPRAAE